MKPSASAVLFDTRNTRTNSPNVRMNHAVLPENQRGVQGGRRDDQGGDNSAGHPQETEGIRESEDCEDDVLHCTRRKGEMSISQTLKHDCARGKCKHAPSNNEVAWTKVKDLSRISAKSDELSSGVTWNTLEFVLIIVGAAPLGCRVRPEWSSDSLSGVTSEVLGTFSLANPVAGLAPGRP